MRQAFKIKPKKGLKIRFPIFKDRILSADGEFVEFNSYWQRRLKDGDIEICSTMDEESKYFEESKKKDEEKTKGLSHDDSI